MKRRKQPVEVNAPQRGGITGKGFVPGKSGNPGGVSKEKRTFLERLTGEDADEVYRALMDLVRDRNPPAVIRAWEYVVGKPRESVEVTGKDGGPLTVHDVDPSRLTGEQLAAFIAALRAAKVDSAGE